METRELGRTRLRASSLWLGTAALAVPYGAPGAERAPPDPAAAAATIEAALAAGITAIDTAPAYGDAEALVGQVAGDTDCLIATKLSAEVDARRSAESSLRALRRDRIDLLQIHNATAEMLGRGAVMSALEDLRAEGILTAIGATVYGEQDALAAIACDGIDVIQIAYSALDRRPERRAIPAAREQGVAVTVRSVLMRGVLSAAGRDLVGDLAPLSTAADAFRRAAGVAWDDLPAAAVAWAVGRPGVDAVVLGPRDTSELASLLRGAELTQGAAVADVEPLPDELVDPRSWA